MYATSESNIIDKLLDRLDVKSAALLRAECRERELEDQLYAAKNAAAMPAPYYQGKEHTIDLIDALAGGRKIEAIKAFRALTGYGLKESKDQVERVIR
jgi:ribosomal protein L7/L12